MAIKIELKDIVKTFGNYTAVDHVNLTIEPEEFLCLLGPSGCGKTTILRMIAGLEVPTSGNIYFNGVEVEKTKVYERNTAMVFQNYALFPHKNVRDNVRYGLRMHKVDKDEIEERVSNALKIVSIDGMDDRYPNQLSGGQQQRVALARAIVYDPAVLLLDEPLSALDKKLRDQMRFELKRIQQEIGITTVFVTHDQEEAMAVADRIVIMDRSVIVQQGAPDDIYKNPKNQYVANFLGTSNILQGTVHEKELVLNGDHRLPLPFDAPHGKEISIAIRPQSLSFTREEHMNNELEMAYLAHSYLGTNIRYLLKYGDAELLLETLNSDMSAPINKYQHGDKMKVYFASQNIIRME